MTLYDCYDPDQRATGIREAAYAVRRGDLIVLPYAISDTYSNFATIEIAALRKLLRG